MTKYLTPKTVLGTIFFTLLLGVISSALWDLLFKPGITEFGRVLLSIATFGSTTIRDFAYASAAIDPTPLPALLMVLFASYSPLIIAGGQFGKIWGRRTAEKSFDEAEKVFAGDIEKLKEALEARIALLQRRLNWIMGILLVVFSAISFTTGSVLNQSVAVWRVFHANLVICAPHLTQLEEKQFRARFTSMTTRVEYLAISNDLQQVAARNGVRLINSQLW